MEGYEPPPRPSPAERGREEGSTMNFELTEEQQLVAESVESFCRKDSPIERFRKMREDAVGYSPVVWKQMGELGWLSLAFPEELGGFGGRFVDLMIVLERFGRTLVPEPYIPSIVMGAYAIHKAGSKDQIERFLAPTLAGDKTLAVAYAEAGGRFDPFAVHTTALRDGEGWTLEGEKVWVENGHAADHLIVAARTSGDPDAEHGISFFILDPKTAGVSIKSLRTMDGRRAAHVSLDGVRVPADRLLGKEGGSGPLLEDLLDRGAAAACAEAAGVMQASLQMTLDYLKTREQFGAKIGGFQALQHRAVDMFVETELAKSVAILAAIRVDDPDRVERQSAVSAAKVQSAESGRFVTRQAIQLFGGIGVTDEQNIGLYFKRMHVLATLYGDEDHHVRRFASLPSFTADVE